MSNQKRLEEYLIGNEEKKVVGYLKDTLSNGKVIMLSGKWGSGKTFFWKEIIEKNLKKEKIPNNYISLYGKSSIQEIKNEVFLKIFEGMDIFKIDEKSFGLAKDTANLITDITKSVSVFGFNLDLSKIVDKSFEKLEKVKEEKKEKDIKNTLNSGAIICFDDFERKSKDIDLNDLIGFITNLTIECDCKVVIILNDDVIEGEEIKIFLNVKEKSVSKFLKYEPEIKDLIETIFENDEEYRKLDDYKEIILKTIEVTEELNARIYIQVLDNLVEWIKYQEIDADILRCLILVNINFILYHTIFYKSTLKKEKHYKIKNFDTRFEYGEFDFLHSNSFKTKENFEDFFFYVSSELKNNKMLYDYLKDNKSFIKSYYNANKLDISENVDDKTFEKINNFIETGILINE